MRVRTSQAEQARLAYERSLLGAIADVESAAAGVVHTHERTDRLAHALAAADRTVELADQRYRTGVRDLFELIDAQREREDIQDQVVRARQAELSESVRLYRALGGAWLPAGDTPETNPDGVAVHDGEGS